MALRKIIAGYDGGERSGDALRFAAVLAAATQAELTIAHAYRYDPPFHAADTRLALRAAATRLLARGEAQLPYGMRAQLRAVEARSVVQGLHDLAETEHADLVVLGATTKGSLELHAVGSVPERLLRAAPCAVAIAPRGYAREEKPGLRVIGVAYDGSGESDHALAGAVELALAAGATVKLIGVVEHSPPPMVGTMAAAAVATGWSEETHRSVFLQRLEEAADALPAELRTEIVLAAGDPADELIERAGILSLLVMGSRGYGPLRRALLGSVTAPVLRAAPCPVLVVPRLGLLGAEQWTDAPGEGRRQVQ